MAGARNDDGGDVESWQWHVIPRAVAESTASPNPVIPRAVAESTASPNPVIPRAVAESTASPNPVILRAVAESIYPLRQPLEKILRCFSASHLHPLQFVTVKHLTQRLQLRSARIRRSRYPGVQQQELQEF